MIEKIPRGNKAGQRDESWTSLVNVFCCTWTSQRSRNSKLWSSHRSPFQEAIARAAWLPPRLFFFCLETVLQPSSSMAAVSVSGSATGLCGPAAGEALPSLPFLDGCRPSLNCRPLLGGPSPLPLPLPLPLGPRGMSSRGGGGPPDGRLQAPVSEVFDFGSRTISLGFTALSSTTSPF